ncbi:Tetratricopeptide repeat-containing protein [Parapedobacter composti]|uniref:Tetratricopeptide repeat-containing protein n=1 Tax=Parapedobacter composti TaxID=623281 RepID=A0A1I1KE93_9SPHI|nr:tetratricopeptide repeat protein [Parapedobacter composti]SFC59126.1 Tetratricopeptide repeat-containing protein [Parapedobacter composti]
MAAFFEQIQDYLDGTLAVEERQAFEQQLKEDGALREELALQRELRDLITKHRAAEAGVSALEATLRQVRAAYEAEGPKKKPGVIRLLLPAIAVAACLLAVFNYVGFFEPDFEQLPEMATSITRDGGADSTYQQAVSAFNEGDYQTSIRLLDGLVSDDTSVVRYRYYRGLSHLGLAQYRKAITDLKPIADGPSVFAGDASYFTAVAWWRLGDHDEALSYVERVTETSDYHKKAERLKKKL